MSKIGAKVNHDLRGIKLNKRNAFEHLIMITHNHLKVVALNYLLDKNDVEDVVNEAYFKVYLYIKSANLQKDGYNWLCKIVQNLSFDYNKRREHNCESFSRIEEENLFYEIEEGFLDSGELYSAICDLAPWEQKLLYYKFWEGRSLSELAEMFHLKRSTVNKKIKSLYKVLEETIKKNGVSS